MKDKNEIVDKLAEATVISTIICSPRYILHSDFLKSKFFSDPFNSIIYWAVGYLVKRGVTTIDTNILSNTLNANASSKAELDKYDIKSVADFVNNAPTLAEDSIDGYLVFAKQVTLLSYKRDLYTNLMQLSNSCFNNKLSIPDLNKKLDDIEAKLGEEYIIADDLTPLNDEIEDLWEDIVNDRNTDGTVGIPSMIPLLNEYLGGYRKNSLSIFVAPPKTGKSTLLMCETIDKVKRGLNVVYFDSEMSDREFFLRMLANLTSIPSRVIEAGTYSKDEAAKIQEAMRWIKENASHIYHRYMPVINFDEVYETCKILKSQDKCDIAVYDYIKSNSTVSSENYNKIGEFTDNLKNKLAGDLEIPVISACQTNRNEDIADSIKILWIATGIIFFFEKDRKEILEEGNDPTRNGTHRLFIKANRYGDKHYDDETGISLCFKKSTSQIWQSPNQPQQSAPYDDNDL